MIVILIIISVWWMMVDNFNKYVVCLVCGRLAETCCHLRRADFHCLEVMCAVVSRRQKVIAAVSY